MARGKETNVKKAGSTQIKRGGYQPFMMVVGLILIFMSLIALFNWGFLGIVYANSFRLFLGESYEVALVGFFYLGAWMVVRGRIFPFNWKVFLGIVLIFSALTTFLHFNVFWGRQIPITDIYSTTYDIFRNEFLTGQHKLSLGGGLLGAVYYQLMGYLFGPFGAYLCAAILFLIGLFLLVGIKAGQIQKALTALGQALVQGVKVLSTKVKEMNRVYHEKRTDKEDMSRPTPSRSPYLETEGRAGEATDDDPYVYHTSPSPSGYQSYPERTNSLRPVAEHLRSWLSHLWPIEDRPLQNRGEADYDEYYSEGDADDYADNQRFASDVFASNASDVYDPTQSFNRKHEWDAFESTTTPLASTASTKREEEFGDTILDLDYFDRLKAEEIGASSGPASASAVSGLSTKRVENSSSPRDVSVSSIPSASGSSLPSSVDSSSVGLQTTETRLESSLTKAGNTESLPTLPSTASGEICSDTLNQALPSKMVCEEQAVQAASETASPPSGYQADYWQANAHDTQNLTHDALENSLSETDGAVSGKETASAVRAKAYQLPGKDLLTARPPVDQSAEYEKINQNITKLEQTFQSFGVEARVVKANLGPAVTKYEVEPAVGVKVSKIVSLTDDIALALAARDIRMEAPIPGKSRIGIEVPNSQISPVSFNEIVDAALKSDKILEVPLGRDVAGAISTADLSKMPHLLIAGSTGSGKSVGMNVLICSLLMKVRPEEVKFLMIDPKKVELTMYNDIPHLLAPVVTNPRKAAKALNQVVEEMERRYELFAAANVRNQESYNEYVQTHNQEEGTGYACLPKIVVFIDELADLMLVAGNEVENAIIRLAQMARAAGIHMIIATQRPSVDVITGIIKANIPSRLAFAVTSGTDSRTILDSNGAEKLLGKGDMLFQPINLNKPVRVQGAFISDAEVERITDFIKAQGPPEYVDAMIVKDDALSEAEAVDDEYFDEAVELIKDQETVSISQLQRKFRIGYNRAARLIDDLEALGYIGPAEGSKPRQVYINDGN